MTDVKSFHLGAVLSITTGTLFPTPDTEYPIDSVYNILNFMTNDNLYTHQLPRVADECIPYLLEQHSWLREIDPLEIRSATNVQTWQEVLNLLVQKYGEYHDVRRIHPEDHEQLDPIEELRRLRPDLSDDQIITISDEDA